MANQSYVCTIDTAQCDELYALLTARGWEISQGPYMKFKASGERVSVAAYESGKLVVQGKGMEEFILYTLEPQILHTFGFGYDAVTGTSAEGAAEEAVTPHGGIDESGKGDFFGPLIIAGVCVDENSGGLLKKLGVCDSKLIHSSAKITKLAESIRLAVPNGYTQVTLMPETYNRLYDKIGNLNRLLAWGHARVIENLLEKNPGCPRMISDKFGSEHLIRNALMERGRKIVLDQHVRAESDVAVAAASILARDGFLRGMAQLSAECKVELPRGAGPQVKAAARKIFAERGMDIFRICAKCHFKTLSEISVQE